MLDARAAGAHGSAKSCTFAAGTPEQPHAVLQVFEECNPDSPYSFQFIDPTRHQPTYGAQRSNATAVLCQASGK